MSIKQIFMEPETEVNWYFDSTEEIVIVYIRNRLKPGFDSNAIGCVASLRALRKRKPQETQALAFLAVFVYATQATQAIAFEWKPGFRGTSACACNTLRLTKTNQS